MLCYESRRESNSFDSFARYVLVKVVHCKPYFHYKRFVLGRGVLLKLEVVTIAPILTNTVVLKYLGEN